MKALKIFGILLIVFGAVDLIGSYSGFDLWGRLGVTLPDLLWKYSSYIEIGLGLLLFNIGGAQPADDAEDNG
ncbi:hypothetical protein [Marinicella meishanensis]|uniref:hypothetical protein n=1 Tax=Marinicella meishanensis TaxID=2873263 RepID=UPI001CBD8C20|nr:hypothetical protein [Marinicella sp. NBU2979]